MSISAKQVKELRDRTGAGMMDCKRALLESDGDVDAAIEYLQKKGIMKAAKKATRTAAEGLIDYWVSDDHKDAILVEMNCETDFVSRNEKFQKFVADATKLIGESGVETVEDALKLNMNGKLLEDAIKEQVATIGENIQLRRIIRVKSPKGFVATYIHGGSQIGVLTAIEGELCDSAEEFGRDVSMHVAAMRPSYLDPGDIAQDSVDKQTEIFTAQVREEGKPEKILPRIVEGKISKWKNENALYEQNFVKNPDITVRQYEKEVGGVKILEFNRLEVGEGIEKVACNLAEEVAATLKDK